jgi:hypothetical protein
MKRISHVFIGLGALLALTLPASAYASCVRLTPAQQERLADVIFDGVALEGPTSAGTQQFRVLRYIKGSGPETARVATGVTAQPNGVRSTTSVSLDVAVGARWRIYAAENRAGRGLETNICLGSAKLGSAERPGGKVTESERPTPPESVGNGGPSKIGLFGTFAGGLALLALAISLHRRRRNTPASASQT